MQQIRLTERQQEHFAIVEHAKRYDLSTAVTAGKGVDRYLDYLEYKDGTPLTFEEIEEIKANYKLQDYIIS